jgi:GNAT superfamily N-acetyltransferase
MQDLFENWAAMPPGSMQGWRLVPYEKDGAVRAIAALQGYEIHFAIAPEWRHKVIARHRARAFIGALLDELGFLTTRAAPDEKADRFLTRLGFVKTMSTPETNYYFLCAAPWGMEH